MSDSKTDVRKLEKDLAVVLARNNKILSVLRRVQEMEIPEGKTPLDVLTEELDKEGLKEAFDETAKI